MPEKAWKVDERKVAKRLNGRRVGLSGGPGSLSKADVLAGRFFVEVKRRARFPGAVWYGKCALEAAHDGRVALLVVHVARSDVWLAVLSLSTLVEIARDASWIEREKREVPEL
mgnify:CR=1 FL=1